MKRILALAVLIAAGGLAWGLNGLAPDALGLLIGLGLGVLGGIPVGILIAGGGGRQECRREVSEPGVTYQVAILTQSDTAPLVPRISGESRSGAGGVIDSARQPCYHLTDTHPPL